ncbi:MAG: DUF805 domain-containing protein [Patescibacteria group bacterium]
MEYITSLFEGRLRRKQWILGFLLLIAASIIISLIASIITNLSSMLGSIVNFAAMIVLLIAHLSIHARRYHDTGKSAWFVILMLIPVVNIIAFIILCFDAGDEGDNAYGPVPNPDESVVDAVFKRPGSAAAGETIVEPIKNDTTAPPGTFTGPQS